MRQRLSNLALELWLPVALIVGWWVASENSTSTYFPSLRTIMTTFADTWMFTRFGSDVVPSMARFAYGLGIALVIGITVGTVLGLVPTLRRAFDPILDFFRALPKPALLPLAIVIFGVGDGMKIFIIAFGTVWPILLNTTDGVRGVDPMLHDMARVFGLTRWQRLWQIILPAASPQMFVGIRLSLSIGLILMVVSEMVASTNGLGFFVLLSQQTFAIPQMWSGIILLGIIGYAVNLVFLAFERRVLRWHIGWRAASSGDNHQPASGTRGRLRRARVVTAVTSLFRANA